MKQGYIIFCVVVIIGLFFVLACDDEECDESFDLWFDSNRYSPLYKYDMFGLERYTDEGVITNLGIKRFIISNTDFVDLDSSNVCHIYLSNGVWLTDVIYTFTNKDFIYYDANLRYVMYAGSSNANPVVFDMVDNKVVLSITQGALSVIARLGNGYSDKLAYGVLRFRDNKYYSGRVFYLETAIVDISSGSNIAFVSNFCLLGFTPDNRYLLYTYYSGVGYERATYCDCESGNILYSNLDDADTNVVVISNRVMMYSYGEFALYDMVSNRSIVVGDNIYETTNEASIYGDDYPITGWSDTIVGVDRDLKYFYVFNLALCMWQSIKENIKDYDNAHYWKRDDGRYIKDIIGIWKVDISSLGL